MSNPSNDSNSKEKYVDMGMMYQFIDDELAKLERKKTNNEIKQGFYPRIWNFKNPGDKLRLKTSQ